MGFDYRVMDDSDQGWHVESVAELFVALFGDMTSAIDGGT